METISAEATTSCVFCRIVRGELTPEVLAFCSSQTAVFPSLHQRPRNHGHMLVVPTRHVAHIYEIGDALAGPLMMTLARVAAAVKEVWRADGVSIRQNNERHGGQDVFHVHFHVIPRFADDAFTTGDDRFPIGAVEVPLEKRVEQAKKLSEALGLQKAKVPGARANKGLGLTAYSVPSRLASASSRSSGLAFGRTGMAERRWRASWSRRKSSKRR